MTNNIDRMISSQATPSILFITIEVEFDGKIYEAKCKISELDAYGKHRAMLYYSDLPPRTVGIFSPENLHEAEPTAIKVFTDYLSELSKFSKDRLVPKPTL